MVRYDTHVDLSFSCIGRIELDSDIDKCYHKSIDMDFGHRYRIDLDSGIDTLRELLRYFASHVYRYGIKPDSDIDTHH